MNKKVYKLILKNLRNNKIFDDLSSLKLIKKKKSYSF